MRRRKTYRKTYSKNVKTFGRGRTLPYAKNDCFYLRSGSPTGALISVATFLLGLALFKKIF